ncbi:SDR family oxidoreductase [Sulfitobacter sp. AS92]|uniref:SDR family NAD(P)-dependent oxidoreductase n=1 Tax=Sulfitobacter sp. AS92 TaxID=3135783 RepID=UPI0031803319
MLSDRTAFVSGSGKNIGRAVAIRLAEAGANVIVNGSTDRDSCEKTAEMIRETGAEALVVMGDMGTAADVERLSVAALERFGRVDILVNNAARRPHKPFLELTDDDWNHVVDVSLTGAFRTARAFLPGMVEDGWGRIINFAGMKAMRGYFEGAPISAAKHGVWGLTKALSREFADKGITANVISPGQIRNDSATEDDTERTASIPARIMGRPTDIAATVGFLASPDAAFITGQMFAVNGGEET